MKIKEHYNFLDIKRLLPYIFIIVFISIGYLTFYIYKPYVLALMIAIIFYIIFRKINNFIYTKINPRKNLAAMISTFIVIFSVIIPLLYILTSLIKEASVAVQYISKWMTPENIDSLLKKFQSILTWLNLENLNLSSLQNDLLSISKTVSLSVLKSSGNMLSNIFGGTANFLFSIFILFFLFKSGDKLGEKIYSNLPFPDEMEKEIGDRLFEVLDAVIKGNMLVAILQGLVIGILFTIFGLPTPILYGTIASFFALIPIIGTSIVWLPGSLYLYFSGNPIMAIVLGIISLIFYFGLENIVKPWLLDKKLKMHPIFLFLAILGGLTQFGLKGLILGPLIVTAFLTIWKIFSLWNIQYGELKGSIK